MGKERKREKCVCKKLANTQPSKLVLVPQTLLVLLCQQTAVDVASKMCVYLPLQQETPICMRKFSF